MKTSKKINEGDGDGVVSQVIGAVVDVRFEGELPKVFTALEVDVRGKTLVLETQQHLGLREVRTVAMSTTDGLSRGTPVRTTGAPISVPVGAGTLGRMFNVVGKAIDGMEEPTTKTRYPIHRDAPKFDDQSIQTEVLETGIKVIDLMCPFLKGGKIGLFGGAGVGKTVIIQELIRNIA
ncbi:MAG: F-type H+-transporting ATPase subunit beta, partial [Parcubacteria group bacterium Greene0416_14]